MTDWSEHVKKYAKKHKMTYQQANKNAKCKKEYQKKKKNNRRRMNMEFISDLSRNISDRVSNIIYGDPVDERDVQIDKSYRDLQDYYTFDQEKLQKLMRIEKTYIEECKKSLESRIDITKLTSRELDSMIRECITEKKYSTIYQFVFGEDWVSRTRGTPEGKRRKFEDIIVDCTGSILSQKLFENPEIKESDRMEELRSIIMNICSTMKKIKDMEDMEMDSSEPEVYRSLKENLHFMKEQLDEF